MSDEPEIRVCPLGPPRDTRPIQYAYCSECQRVRKSTLDCPVLDPVYAFSSEHPGWTAYWQPGMTIGDAIRRMLTEQ